MVEQYCGMEVKYIWSLRYTQDRESSGTIFEKPLSLADKHTKQYDIPRDKIRTFENSRLERITAWYETILSTPQERLHRKCLRALV